jgi:uncharacterized membrane protein
LLTSKSNFKYLFLLRSSLFIAAGFWFIGIISPCIKNVFLNSNYPFLKMMYSTVCHQNTLKSFSCNNTTLLVCARCTGIYLGVLVTSFVILFTLRVLRIKTIYLLLFSFPMLADVILYSIGFYHYNKIIASITGFLFGSVVFLYILNAIENSLIKNDNVK